MKLPFYSAGLILGLAAGTLYAQSTFPVNQVIPDGNPVGLTVTGTMTNFFNYSLVTSVTLGLNVSGGYNGDLYAELVSPDGGVVTLFNQPGVTAGNPFGFGGSGMNVTFSDLAVATLQSSPETAGTTVTGQYQPLTALNTLAYTHANGAWTWLTYSFCSMFAAVTPPTPTAMLKDLQDDRQSVFLQMIGDAGYKIKEIENGIGLPPDITLKFGRIRNLSDADLDYIDRELSRWQHRDTGMIAEAQRAVITTLVSITQSDSSVVDSVRLRLLPLPQVKFTLAPTVGGLGWESSQLMRAIQRLDRRVADFKVK